MAVDRERLEALAREDLVVEARRWGARRPEVMTRVELVDEIVRLGTPNPVQRKQARGFLGVARDLVASLVDKGLNLPDAAALIRGDVRYEPLKGPQPPVATVTLAEIYGAQGHYQRALTILDEVLEKEPEHGVARRLRDRIARERTERRGDSPKIEAEPVEEPSEPDDVEERPTVFQAPPASAADDDGRPTLVQAPPVQTAPVFAADDDRHPTLVLSRPQTNGAAILEEAPVSSERPTPIPGLSDEPDAQTLPPPPDALTLPPPPHTDPPSAPPVPSGALVLVRPSPSQAVIYFEVDGDLGAELVVRVVELRPKESGAERVEHDLDVSEASGTVTVSAVEPSAVLRAALGVKDGAAFRAIAVAPEVGFLQEAVRVVWAPRKGQDYAELAERAVAALPAV